jgi:DNA invertase Pin-like site-specific DNA recombinase
VTRALLYLRQSDSDGAGERSLSLESQSSVLRADAARFGWTIVAELRDADLKGHDEKRPGLQEVYTRCREGAVDVVAFWKLDRLARSLRIQENVAYELSRLSVDLYSNQEPWVANPLFRQILGAVAEQQTRDIAANIRRALRAKQQSGIHHGNLPWGYVRADATSPLAIEPTAAALVADIYAQRLRGVGPAEIARDLTRRGIATPTGLASWRVCSISRILRCATYRGAVHAGDTWVEGAHPAIVAPEEWWQAQERHQRRAPRQKLVRSWLEGHIEHGCGLPMYLIQAAGTRRAYFRCRAGHAGILSATQQMCPVEPRRVVLPIVEEAAWAAITKTLAAKLSPEVVLADAQREYRRHAPVAEAARGETRARHDRAVARRERAESLYLSGARDRAWFDSEDARITAELAAVAREAERIPAAPDETRIRATWQELRTLSDGLDTLDTEERGAVLHALGVVVVGDGGVSLRFRPGCADFFRSAHHTFR